MTSWAVVLEGHDFDLEDWKDSLSAPFDPVVETTEIPDGSGGRVRAYLLKAAAFVTCRRPREVRERAIPLVRVLNGLIAHSRSRPVTFSTVVEQVDDGSYRRHAYIALEGLEFRLRGSAITMTVSGLSKAPEPSSVQKALEVATGDVLAAL